MATAASLAKKMTPQELTAEFMYDVENLNFSRLGQLLDAKANPPRDILNKVIPKSVQVRKEMQSQVISLLLDHDFEPVMPKGNDEPGTLFHALQAAVPHEIFMRLLNMGARLPKVKGNTFLDDAVRAMYPLQTLETLAKQGAKPAFDTIAYTVLMRAQDKDLEKVVQFLARNGGVVAPSSLKDWIEKKKIKEPKTIKQLQKVQKEPPKPPVTLWDDSSSASTKPVHLADAPPIRVTREQILGKTRTPAPASTPQANPQPEVGGRREVRPFASAEPPVRRGRFLACLLLPFSCLMGIFRRLARLFQRSPDRSGVNPLDNRGF